MLITLRYRDVYINQNNNKSERFVGEPTMIEVNSSIFDLVQKEKNIRLSEVELNNLIGLKDITTL